jgi:hypothetical protein
MRLDGTSTEQRCDPGDAGGSWRGHSKKGRGEVIARKNVPSSPCRRTTRNRIIFYEGIVSALHIGSLTTRASSSPSSLPITAYPRIPTSLPRAPLRSLAPCISRGDAERHCVHSREGNGKELAFFLFLSIRAILFASAWISALRLFERSKSLPGVSHLHSRVPQTRRHFITGPITPGVTSRVPSIPATLPQHLSHPDFLLGAESSTVNIFYRAFTGTVQLLLMFACITLSSQLGKYARLLRAIQFT